MLLKNHPKSCRLYQTLFIGLYLMEACLAVHVNNTIYFTVRLKFLCENSICWAFDVISLSKVMHFQHSFILPKMLRDEIIYSVKRSSQNIVKNVTV